MSAGRYYSKRGTPPGEKLRARSAVAECGCILWTGPVNEDGYGMVWAFGRTRTAHRVAWQVANGPIPPGKVVRHSCDTPACINLNHLLLGTQADNVADRDDRKRRIVPRGEANWSSKLTEQQAAAIFAATGKHRDIARRFGTSKSNVTGIKSGARWSHLQHRTENRNGQAL